MGISAEVLLIAHALKLLGNFYQMWPGRGRMNGMQGIKIDVSWQLIVAESFEVLTACRLTPTVINHINQLDTSSNAQGDCTAVLRPVHGIILSKASFH